MGSSTYFRRTYDETMNLMLEARNYMAYVEARQRRVLPPVAGLRMTTEAMRVTSRLIQVMAWLMVQRAVHDGELSTEALAADEHRLSGAEVCLDETLSGDATLPKGLRDLLDRSLRLYTRVARLDEQVARRLH